METDIVQANEEACWPVMLIWERITQAYTSDSPPAGWGLQKGEFGFQSWIFSSNNERFTVVWDKDCSYWKVNSPFEKNTLFFVGPLFIDKSRTGLLVPPLFTVLNSDKDLLIPANPVKVSDKHAQIAQYLFKPFTTKVPDSTTSQK